MLPPSKFWVAVGMDSRGQHSHDITVNLLLEYRGDLLIVAQLEGGESILELENEHLRATKGRRWEFVISTNEPAYGGRAAARLRSHAKVVLTEPELIVFCEQDGQDP